MSSPTLCILMRPLFYFLCDVLSSHPVITETEERPFAKLMQFVGDAIYCGRRTGLRQYASTCKDCPKKYIGYSMKTTCGGNCRVDERLGKCVRKGIP